MKTIKLNIISFGCARTLTRDLLGGPNMEKQVFDSWTIG